MVAEHYDDVKIALDQEMYQASGNQTLTCTDLLQKIDTHYQFSVDKGIPFELALALTTTRHITHSPFHSKFA